MLEEETRDCTSVRLVRSISSGNCASFKTARFTRENTPAFLSNGTLATIIRNETSSHNNISIDEVGAASRGTEMGRGIAKLETNVGTTKQTLCNEFDRTESRICMKNVRCQHAHSFDDRNVHITTCLGEDPSAKLNSAATCSEDFNNSKESTGSNISFIIRPNRGRIKPRRYSLPSCLSKVSVTGSGEIAINREVSATDAINILPSSDHSQESCCIELSTAHLVAPTPPPSYRSLITHNLSDTPPSYECVTGLSLNSGRDPLVNAQKCSLRNHESSSLEPQSKILIVLIVLIVLLVTVILALAEAFAI